MALSHPASILPPRPDIPQHDPRRRAGSKILIDATKHPYPPAARVPKQYIDAVQKKWSEYGFK